MGPTVAVATSERSCCDLQAWRWCNRATAGLEPNMLLILKTARTFGLCGPGVAPPPPPRLRCPQQVTSEGVLGQTDIAEKRRPLGSLPPEVLPWRFPWKRRAARPPT